METLDNSGVVHEPIKGGGPGLSILEFRDPTTLR